MLSRKWEIDDQTIVELKCGLLGKETVLVNGSVVLSIRNLTKFKSALEFKLPRYREGKIDIKMSGMSADAELRVDNQLIIPSFGKSGLTCKTCQASNKLNDRFCHSCGIELPSAETISKELKVKEATSTILVLAVLFTLFGIFMFYSQKAQYDNALSQISAYKDHETFPNLINGKKYVVSELKIQLYAEKYGVLALNIFLSLIMVGLSFYAKKSPLGALLIATSIYLALQVLNAIVDPSTIHQGFVMKIIIIGALIKGIRSALELRTVRVIEQPKL